MSISGPGGRPQETDAAVLAWAQPAPVTTPTVDPDAYALADVLRNLVSLGAFTTDRSTQVSLGSSEAGHPCDRRLSYKLRLAEPTDRLGRRTAATNFRDPLRALVGSGVHSALADIFERLDGGSGRFLVESKVDYRGIPGTADLFDRWSGTVIDWKTTLKSRVSRVRSEGPRPQYVTQVQLYAAALAARGEAVRSVALAFIPVDGELAGMYVWRSPFDVRIADAAVDRLDRLRGTAPERVKARPDELCPWCSHYLKGSTDLSVGCPGKTE